MLKEFGPERQRRLMVSSALVIGLGGLGAPVATYLVSSGIGRIGLCDNDIVSETNLQRQILYTEHDLGKSKTDCARTRLAAMSSRTRIDIFAGGLNADNAPELISQYDIVLDCTDNFATRLLIDETCAAVGRPWVHAALDGFTGCVTVFNHNAGRRYTDLYPDARELADAPRRMIGTLGPVPGAIGSMQAIEAIKVLTGCGESLDGRLLLVDLEKMTMRTIEF